jgi:hypothetical protein
MAGAATAAGAEGAKATARRDIVAMTVKAFNLLLAAANMVLLGD